jgi:uncharacterized protein HemX
MIRMNKPRLQLSLRMLLLIVALAAVLVAWYQARHDKRQLEYDMRAPILKARLIEHEKWLEKYREQLRSELAFPFAAESERTRELISEYEKEQKQLIERIEALDREL